MPARVWSSEDEELAAREVLDLVKVGCTRPGAPTLLEPAIAAFEEGRVFNRIRFHDG
jgi:hypothetical protein